MDLTDPDLDYVSLAAGFGMAGKAVSRPEEVAPAVREAFVAGVPYLLDIRVSGDI